MREKKQLLLISSNGELILEMKELLSIYFHVTNVESIHVGYSTALELSPDLIFIDTFSLKSPCEDKNLSNFRSTHLLIKSWIFLLIPDETDGEMLKGFKEIADGLFRNSTSLEIISRRIINQVYVRSSLSNYWKDCFMGMFNFMPKPVLLLEQNMIVAMNDEFKQIFRPSTSKSQQFTDFVDLESKAVFEASLRNFLRGKYIRESLPISLLLNNNKCRNAIISFSKLKKGMDKHYIIMVDFTGSGYLSEQNRDIQPSNVENYIKEDNSLCDFTFTKREKEIIKLLCKGYKTKDISSALFISSKTVENHRSNILKKTKCDTMLESIVYALNQQLIEVNVG